MNKYKVGDKVVMEITDKISVMEEPWYVLSEATSIFETYLDKAAEPLSTYTEPMEAKIRRQAAEITRLLAENKELKEQMKFDLPTLISEEDRRRMDINKARTEGTEAAWELAKKIILNDKGCYSGEELKEIFGYAYSQTLIRNYTYPEAAAKIAEWEKAKEEIKVGDVFQDDDGNNAIVTSIKGNTIYYMWDDGDTRSGFAEDVKKHFTKTGRHIDIDSFLKQIGGGDDEK